MFFLFYNEILARLFLWDLFEKVESVHWKTLDCRIIGNKAFCEYRRTARFNDGLEEEFLSVDILTFSEGLITHKDTYYKQRT